VLVFWGLYKLVVLVKNCEAVVCHVLKKKSTVVSDFCEENLTLFMYILIFETQFTASLQAMYTSTKKSAQYSK
jgi:hypothetical protein